LGVDHNTNFIEILSLASAIKCEYRHYTTIEHQFSTSRKNS